jgi:hypothetical protein
MLDVYMVLMLAAAFGAFYGFASWCNRLIEDKGEGSR